MCCCQYQAEFYANQYLLRVLFPRPGEDRWLQRVWTRQAGAEVVKEET